jgi:transcriptional regulator with XRE-family HTH domain
VTTIQVPDWDVHDRVRKAMRNADVGVSQLADYMGVNRSTVSTWINGRIIPPMPALRVIAQRCEVPFEWLRDGDDSEVRRQGLEPRTR